MNNPSLADKCLQLKPLVFELYYELFLTKRIKKLLKKCFAQTTDPPAFYSFAEKDNSWSMLFVMVFISTALKMKIIKCAKTPRH